MASRGGRPRQSTALVRNDDETFEDLVVDALRWEGASFNIHDGLREFDDADDVQYGIQSIGD